MDDNKYTSNYISEYLNSSQFLEYLTCQLYFIIPFVMSAVERFSENIMEFDDSISKFIFNLKHSDENKSLFSKSNNGYLSKMLIDPNNKEEEFKNIINSIDSNLIIIEQSIRDISLAMPKGYLSNIFNYMDKNKFNISDQLLILAFILKKDKHDEYIESRFFSEQKKGTYLFSKIMMGFSTHDLHNTINKWATAIFNMQLKNEFDVTEFESIKSEYERIQMMFIMGGVHGLMKMAENAVIIKEGIKTEIKASAFTALKNKLNKYFKINAIKSKGVNIKDIMNLNNIDSNNMLIDVFKTINYDSNALYEYILKDDDIDGIKRKLTSR